MVIEIVDDGRGIDADRLVEKALERGLISPERARSMGREEALDLIFAPGLSTARQVSEISGRGVGMDVVRSNITALGGAVSVESEPGEGCRFRIQLPLTLAVTTVVVVSCGDETYAIPMEAVSETVKVHPSEIRLLKGEWAVSLRGDVVGVRRLAELLGVERRAPASPAEAATDGTGRLPILVAQVGDTRFGLLVDDFRGQQEIVVKPLASFLSHLPGLGGVTIMGDGTLVLVLDPARLLQLAVAPPGTPAEPEGEPLARVA